MDQTVTTHYPIAIQPHGAILVLNQNLQVIQFSENVEELLETPVHQITVSPIATFLSIDDPNENITTWLKESDNQYRLLIWGAKKTKQKMWGHITRAETYIILELEPISESAYQHLPDLSHYMLASSQATSFNIETTLQTTCDQIRKITGFDRVFVYQFNAAYDASQIIAESLKKDLKPYKGLYFPKTYIPENLQIGLLKIPINYIPNAKVSPVTLMPDINPITGKPTNLNFTNLAMFNEATYHLMMNLKAEAQTICGIIYDDQLWGLVVCQHRTPKNISIDLRFVLSLLTNTLSKEIHSLEQMKQAEEKQRIARLQTMLVRNINKEDSLIYALDYCHADIMELLFATGMSVYFQENLFSYGKTPTNTQVTALLDYLKTHQLTTFKTESLPNRFPDSTDYKDIACGLLVLPISSIEDNFVLFYRPEFIHSLTWGENPADKSTGIHTAEDYIQTITLHSLPWTGFDVENSELIRNLMVDKQLHDLLQIKAMHDPLTGLLNHLYIEEQLKVQILRASREGHAVSIIHTSIEGIQGIIHTHGDAAGDLVLAAVANFLKAYFREYDFIYRNGNDEFLLLLPNVGHDTAIKRLEILHSNILNLKVKFENKLLPYLSLCSGVTTYPDDGKDANKILSIAKKALSLAKEQGPNHIVVAESSQL